MLLGFGLGALIVAKQGNPRKDPQTPAPDDQLRARAIEAQRTSAKASQRARELTALYQESEKVRRRGSAVRQGREETTGNCHVPSPPRP